MSCRRQRQMCIRDSLELVHEIRNDGRLVRVFDLGEGEDFEGDLPRLAHAGDGSPSARPDDG